MTSIVTRDVPDDIVAALKKRARAAGMSLQAYTLDLFRREVRAPTNAELAARMRRAASLDLTEADVPALIDQQREGRP